MTKPFHEANEISQNLMFERVTRVPSYVGHADTTGKGNIVPGRDNAGWTVYGFKNAFEAANFVAAYPHAAMPCWKRFETINGELIQVR